MKRILSFTLLCMCLSLAIAHAKPIKIKVKTPGSLPQLLESYQPKDNNSLTINGTLSESDIKSLTRFVSYNNDSVKVNRGQLETLDLSQATLTDYISGEALKSLLKGASSIKRVTLGPTFYLANATFYDMPHLESVDFKGQIGHMDGYMFADLPRLQTITFHKDILCTGGTEFVRNCPMLHTVTFNGAILICNYGAPIECPQLKGYSLHSPIIASSDSITFPETHSVDRLKHYQWKSMYNHAKQFYQQAVTDTSMAKFFLPIARLSFELCGQTAQKVDDGNTAAQMKALLAQCEQKIKSLPHDSTKLEILQAAAPYKRTGQTSPAFTYASPNDSLLTRTREYFHLDQVAGTGDDLSRIKNLLYWVHDLVRHDGSSGWPNCRFNCVDLYNICQKEKRPLNCRFMAIMLCEALLAENIPARYIVCMPRAYATDPDCHVITVAWSRQLNKWVWVDPTFCAYVTDENGLWLHPGEVRERLRNGQPLRINEDANWNHESKQYIENYLYDYMAKNLYLINTNIHSKSEPEDINGQNGAHYLLLIPERFDYKQVETTTDDAYFWQAPPQELVK